MFKKKGIDKSGVKAALDYANNIIATLRESFLVLDKNLRVISANRSFYDTFKVAKKDTIGRPFPDLGNRQWDIPKLITLLMEILPEKRAVENYEVEHEFKDIGQRTMSLNAYQLRVPKKVAEMIATGVIIEEEEEEELILLAIEDITERKRLWVEEHRYRTLIENLPQKVFLKDRNSVYISCNKNYARDLNIKPEEIAGKTDHDFFPTNLAEKYREDDKRVMDSRQTENIEEEYMVMKDFLRGAQRSIINTIKVPIRDKDGDVTGLFGLFWDITDRKQAEDDLRESELKFRTIFNGGADGTLIVDPESRKFYIGNDAICRMLGYNKNEITKLRVEDIHPEKDLPYVISQFEAQSSGKITLAEDLPVKRKDGSIFFADINATNVIISGKRYLMGFFRDITYWRSLTAEREKTLKWQQNINELRQLLLAPAPLDDKLKVITDSIVRIFDADFCRIWLIRQGDLCQKGCIHAEVKEGPHACLYRNKCLHLVASSGRYTHIDGRGHARVPFGCYKIGSVASGEEHRFLTNDVVNDPRVHNHEWARELGLVSFAGYQLKVPGGETIGVLALFAKHTISPVEDAILDNLSVTTAFVTQQAAIDEEKVRTLGIKASSEIKSQFASMVSHELRSPLAVIKESLNLVLEGLAGSISDEQKDILDTAKNNTDRLGRLINNVLDFQKIENGKMKFDIRENNINDLIMEAGKAMNLLAEEKNLDFTLNFDEEMPMMRFDRDKIAQVLTNLISNAVKFTEKGGISVTAKQEGNIVHVTVEDTGPGIRAEDIQKLFKTFEQLGGGLGKKRGGTGLGLAISKDIILAHNGKIWAESKFGEGSKFHFTLPIKERRG